MQWSLPASHQDQLNARRWLHGHEAGPRVEVVIRQGHRTRERLYARRDHRSAIELRCPAHRHGVKAVPPPRPAKDCVARDAQGPARRVAKRIENVTVLAVMRWPHESSRTRICLDPLVFSVPPLIPVVPLTVTEVSGVPAPLFR